MQKAPLFGLFIIGVSLLLVQETVAGDLAMRLASYPYMPIWTTGNVADVRTVEEAEEPNSDEEMQKQMRAAREASKRVRYILDRLYAGRRR